MPYGDRIAEMNQWPYRIVEGPFPLGGGRLLTVNAWRGNWGTFPQPLEEPDGQIHPVTGSDNVIEKTIPNSWQCASVDNVNDNDYDYPEAGFEAPLSVSDGETYILTEVFIAGPNAVDPGGADHLNWVEGTIANSLDNVDPQVTIRLAPSGATPVVDADGIVKNPDYTGNTLNLYLGFPHFKWNKAVAGTQGSATAEESTQTFMRGFAMRYTRVLAAGDLSTEPTTITVNLDDMEVFNIGARELDSNLSQGDDPHWVTGIRDYELEGLKLKLSGDFTFKIIPLRLPGDNLPDEPEPGDPGGNDNPFIDFDVKMGEDDGDIMLEIDTVDENGDPITVEVPRTNDSTSFLALLKGTADYELPCQGSDLPGFGVLNYAGKTFRFTLTIDQVEWSETSWTNPPSKTSDTQAIIPPIEVVVEGQFPSSFSGSTYRFAVNEIFSPPIVIDTFGGTIPTESPTVTINLPPGFALDGNDLVLESLSFEATICDANSIIEDGLDDDFNDAVGSAFNNSLWDIGVTDTDSMIVGGTYTNFNGNTRNRLIELNADGTENTSFYSNFGGITNTITTITVQPDDKILIGGLFTTYNGNTRNRLIRINSDGTEDTLFYQNSPKPTNEVRATAIQSDGTIIVGGRFTGLTATVTGGLLINTIDGAAQTRWNPDTISSTQIHTAVLDGNDIIIGGIFTSVQGITRNRIAKLSGEFGVVDATWNPNANNFVNTLVLDGNDLYVGGLFTSIVSTTRNRIARIHKDTAVLDSTWNPNVSNNQVYAIAISGSSVFFSGNFTQVASTVREGIAKVNNTDGALDGGWNVPVTAFSSTFSSIRAIHALLIDGTDIVFAGVFSQVDGTPRNSVARVSIADGTLDTWTPETFNLVNIRVFDLKKVNDDYIVSGLNVAAINTYFQNTVAISSITGVHNPNWVPGINGRVYGVEHFNDNLYAYGIFTEGRSYPIASAAKITASTAEVDLNWFTNFPITSVFAVVKDDTDIYFGGSFATIQGVTRNKVAKVNDTTGLLDAWAPNITGAGEVNAILVDGDDFYAVGTFATTSNIQGQTRLRALRVHKDTGTLDSTWNPNVNNTINSIIKNATHVYLGGTFTSITSVTVQRLARVNLTDGAVDATWIPTVSSTVNALYIDGTFLYVGGAFTTIESLSQRLARFDLTSDLIDTGWNPVPSSTVNTISKYDDAIYIGGQFSSVNSISTLTRLARVNLTDGELIGDQPTINWGFGASPRKIIIDSANDHIYAIKEIGGSIDVPAILRFDLDTFERDEDWYIAVPNSLQDLIFDGTSLFVVGSFGTINYNEVISNVSRYDDSTFARDESWFTREGIVSGLFATVTRKAATLIFDSTDLYIIGYQTTTVNSDSANGILALTDTGALDSAKNSNFAGGMTTSLPTNLFSSFSSGTYTVPNDLGTGFANTTGIIDTLVIQSDDKILVGGLFEGFGGEDHRGFVRLNNNGTLDTAFNYNLDLIYPLRGFILRAITIDDDDHIIIGGSVRTEITFDTFAHSPFIMRIDSTGLEDTDFTETIGGGFNNTLSRSFGFRNGLASDGQILALEKYQDKILVGGDFRLFDNGTSRNKRFHFAFLTKDGEDVTNLYYGGLLQNAEQQVEFLNAAVRAIAVTNDGGIVLGGDFNSSLIHRRAVIAKLDRNTGALDTTWRSSANIPDGAESQIFPVSWGGASQLTTSGDEIIFGGNLSRLGIGNSFFLARKIEKEIGTVKLNFKPEFNNFIIAPGFSNATSTFGVQVLLVDSTDLYLGGTFGTINNLVRLRAAKIDLTDNTVDSDWNPIIQGTSVNAIVKNGSAIYLAGLFNGIGSPIESVSNTAKVNDTDGGLDSGWKLKTNAIVRTMAMDSPNLYIGGDFTALNAAEANRVTRLSQSSAESTFDFNVDASSNVFTIVVDATDVFIGGSFFNIQGIPRNRLGKVELGLGLVESWSPDANNTVLSMIKIGSDLYFGGQFTGLANNTITRNRVAKTDDVIGIVNPDWDPSCNNNVEVLLQAGSEIVLGGTFTEINSKSRNRFAEISLSTGAVTDLVADTSHAVRAILVDGSTIYLGGEFEEINSVTRYLVGAITSTGTVTGWDPFNSFADGSVRTFTVDSTHVYIGGSGLFVYSPSFNEFYELVRASKGTTTTIDTSWAPDPWGSVYTLAIDSGFLYVGGDFFGIDSEAQEYLARLTASSGAIDLSWTPVLNDTVNTLLIDGSALYIGGSFTSVNSDSRNQIAKLILADGATDSWNANVDGSNPVFTIAVDSTDVYFGGSFTSVNSTTRNRAAKVNKTTGALDADWDPNAGSVIYAITLDGSSVYLGGWFTTMGGEPRTRIAKVDNTDGDVDPNWANNANNTVFTLTTAGGSLLMGGSFQTLGAASRLRIAKVDTTLGSITSWDLTSGESTFQVSSIQALYLDGDDLYIGGNFTQLNSVTRNRIARVDINTAAVDSWNPNANNIVYAIAEYDDNIYIGGQFTQVSSTTRNRAAKIGKATGTLDSTWNPNVGNNIVRSIKGNATGIYLGGTFTNINGITGGANRIARVNDSNGLLNNWEPRLIGTEVRELHLVGTDVYAVGAFTSVNEITKVRVAKTALSDGEVDESFTADANQPVWALLVEDTHLYVGGQFTNLSSTTRNRIGRVNKATGAIDGSWNPNVNSSIRSMVIVGTDIYFSGDFDTVSSTTRHRVAKYAINSNTLDATFVPPQPIGGLPVASPTSSILRNILVDNDDIYILGNILRVITRSSGRIIKLTGNSP